MQLELELKITLLLFNSKLNTAGMRKIWHSIDLFLFYYLDA